MDSTWDARDFRVLEAIVQIVEETGSSSVRASDIAARTEFDAETVQTALRALSSEDPPYFTAQGTWGGGILRASNPTGHARRAVGAWPTAQGLSERLIAQLEIAANDEQDDGKKSKLKQLAEFFASGGRDLLVAVATQAITG
ncbi:hypothetical protein [Mycobacteroides abscessus]|uniref:hypothetical protein n=1 Tax=Mycobacteroides abscessus TaxID=36809 RepID=UPI0019CF8122|nr:hypothetical protein [Mycobacteroides abscessus]MBN7483775.1 hypothetical protein [Mycobacteroides abscessus subsp. massiliense]